MTAFDRPDRPGDDEEAFERLVGTLAHELRTPLAVIVGYAELLLLRDDEETRRAAPKAIHDAGRALLARLDELVSEAWAHGERPD
jgi:signal transduction histidine kinase